MPVVKTTSPQTSRAAPTASPSKPRAVLDSSRTRRRGSTRLTRHSAANVRSPVGDGAGGDGREHAAAQAAAREAAVLRAALVAGLADLPLRVEVEQAEVRRLADARSRGSGRSDQRGARRQLLDDAAPAAGRPAARARCRRRRTRSPGRSCPSAPPRRAPPSPRARAARGRWRCSRSCRRAGPSISAWRSSSARSGGFIFSRVSRRSSSASSVSVRWCGEASPVIRTPRALASATASTDSRALTGAGCGCGRPRSRRARRRGRSSSTRRSTGCRRARAARRPRPRA